MCIGLLASLAGLNHSWFLFVFNVYLFRERGHEQEVGRERGRERERIPGRFCTVSTEPNAGLEPMNREIMTLAEIELDV